MLVQSRQAGRRHAHPRVGAARADRELEPGRPTGPTGRSSAASRQLGLTMYGQMTAGSWIYIGTQGILQGTYETFAAVAAKRFGGTLAGTITLTAGLGGMGGAQPLAVTHERRRRDLHRRRPDAASAPADRAPLPRRGRPTDLDDAVARCGRRARRARAAVDRPASATARPCCPELLRRGVADRHRHRPDVARTTRCRTCPIGVDVRRLARLRRDASPRSSPTGPGRRWPRTSRRWSGSRTRGAEVFDYGNSIRAEARARAATTGRSTFPGFVPGLHPAAVLRGQGPVPLGGAVRRPGGHRARPTGRSSSCSPTTSHLHRWITLAQERVAVPGPARRGSAGSATASATTPGCGSTSMVASRRALRADRDRPRPPRLRLGRLARTGRPRRWPTAPTRSPTGRCSTRWSTPRPARPGCRSTTAAASASAARIHAGQVMRRRRHRRSPRQKLERVLTNDPGMGVIRHVDAGYERAGRVAAEARGVRVPDCRRVEALSPEYEPASVRGQRRTKYRPASHRPAPSSAPSRR